jgi:hypothetical protein
MQQPPLPPLPQEQTVLDAMIASGVNNLVLFNGTTAAERIATDIFDDDFESCLSKDFKDLEDDFKSYSTLTVANGQIRLTPGTKKKIKGFIQWTRDMINMSRDPSTLLFPHEEAGNLIKRYKDNEAYRNKSKNISDTAKPEKFSEQSKWDEWKPVFMIFLRSIPGRNGVPLSYIVRDNDNPIVPLPFNQDFLDDYIQCAPLNGIAFVIDAQEVHMYLTNFMAGNSTAESKMLPHSLAQNGRLDFRSLQDHYEGVGLNTRDITAADKIIESLHYSGECKPHICGGMNLSDD